MRIRAAFFVFVVMLGTGCVRQKFNDMALHPHRSFSVTPEDFGLEYEILTVPVEDATIHAWFFPAEGADTAAVVCGGNTGNKGLFLPLARALVAEGYHAVLLDYRGYGFSTGEPDLWSLVSDVRALLSAVRARPEVSRVGMVGLSLGSVVALGVADRADGEVDAVVVEGTFLADEMLDEFAGAFLGTIAAPFVIPSGWDVEDHAEELPVPVLFIHGPEDRVTPLLPVARLFASAAGNGLVRGMWIAEGAGHVPGIAAAYAGEFIRHITRFFDAFARRDGPDLRVRTIWEREPGGLVAIDLAPPADLSDRAPVEVAAVFPGEEVVFRRAWLTPGVATRVELPATIDPVLATATIPAGPVEERGDGWRRSDSYFRSRRDWREREGPLLRTLGESMVIRIGDTRISFSTEEEELSPGERLEAARVVERELEEFLAGDVHPWVRPLCAGLLLTIGKTREELGDGAGARRARTRYLDLVPDDPASFFSFGDASWQFGWSAEEVAEVHQRLAASAPTEEERIAHTAKAAEWRAKGAGREKWLVEWASRQTEAGR